jgi:hypothetical protein
MGGWGRVGEVRVGRTVGSPLIYSKALGSSLQGEKSTTNIFPALMGITRFGMELLQSKNIIQIC